MLAMVMGLANPGICPSWGDLCVASIMKDVIHGRIKLIGRIPNKLVVNRFSATTNRRAPETRCYSTMPVLAAAAATDRVPIMVNACTGRVCNVEEPESDCQLR